MSSRTIDRPVGREEQIEGRFEREAGQHRMTVLHDDGVYRHLRFARRGTWAYGYDLTTWPGHLSITGDCGSYTFSRVHDMFSFFRAGQYGGLINPGYWAEKITNRDAADGTRKYDEDVYERRVREWLDDAADSYGLDDDEMAVLRREAKTQLIDGSWMYDGLPGSREDAVRRLMDFDCAIDGRRVEIYEPYDWSLHDWDWQYLWCCWAVVQGIAQYDWAKGWR